MNRTEQEIQDAVVKLLQSIGCSVFETNTHGIRGGTGVTKGIPDLLVGYGDFPRGVLIGFEIKIPKGWKWSSYEQAQAWLDGNTFLCFGEKDALLEINQAARRFSASLLATRAETWLASFPDTRGDDPGTKSIPPPFKRTVSRRRSA